MNKSTGQLIVFFIFFNFLGLTGFSQSPEVSFQRGHNRAVKSLCFSHDDQTLVTAGRDGNLIFWDVKSGRQIRSVLIDTSSLIKLRFSLNDSLIYGLSGYGILSVWNVATGNPVAVMNGTTGRSGIRDFEIFKDGGGIFVFRRDSCILLDNQLSKTIAGFSYYFFQVPILDEEQKTLIIVKEDVEFACPLGRGEKTFDSISSFCRKFENRKTLNLAKRMGRILRNAYNVQFDRMNAIAYPGGKKYLEINQGRKIVRKNLLSSGYYSSGSNVFRIGKWKDAINAFDVNAEDIFAATERNGILVLNEKNGNLKTVLKASSGSVRALKFSSDKKLLAAGYSDGSVLIWDIESGSVARNFDGIQARYSGIKYADGKKIISGTLSGDLRIWNFETNEMQYVNLNAGASVSNKNKFLVTGIEGMRGDSVVLFKCLKARVNENFDYSERFYYKGEWNAKSNTVALLEIELNRDVVSEAVLFKPGELKVASDSVEIRCKGYELIISKANKEELRIGTSHASPITGLALNTAYSYVSTCSWDGTIRHYNLETGKELFVCGAFGKNNYFYFLQEGEYYVSKKALRYLSFSIGAKTFPFEQFDMVYNRPDKVMQQIPGMDGARLEIVSKAIEKRRNRNKNATTLINARLPQLKVEHNKKLLVQENRYKFSVSAKDSSAEITDIHVMVNGVPEKKLFINPSLSVDANIELTLSSGINVISVFAENKTGLLSLKEEFTVNNKEKEVKPDLYLVCIGSGTFSDSLHNLKYAEKDARDISSFFGKTKMYRKVYPLLISGKNAERSCLSKIKNHFSAAGKNDVVLLFFAGHGLLDKDLNYFLSTYSTDFSSPEVNAISYDSIQEILSQAPARKRLFLLDACHSGELDRQEPMVLSNKKTETDGAIVFRGTTSSLTSGASAVSMQAFQMSKFLFADLSASQGLSVISSAGGAELAMEGEQWKNGVFTYCLLNGLKSGKADADKSGKTSVSELLNFVNTDVVRLTNGLQTPTGRAENLQLDFNIYK